MAVTPYTTNLGKFVITDRLQTTQGTYSHGPSYLQMGEGDLGTNKSAFIVSAPIGGRTAIPGTGTSNGTFAESITTTSVASDTYQVIGTLTASGQWAITECGMMTLPSSGTSNPSNVMFAYADFNVVNLNTSDSIQFTWQVQFT